MLRLLLAMLPLFSLHGVSLAKEVRLPVHHAVQHGQVQLVRQLIAAGAEVNTQDEAGRTPFELAIELGNDVLAALLLHASVGVKGYDEKGWSPLHFAVLSNEEWLVREFIQEGAHAWLGRRQNVFYVAELMDNEAMLLRVLAEEDQLGNGLPTWSDNQALAELIARRNLSAAVRDILDSTPTLPATSRAQLALLVDDEAEFHHAINAGANHTRVWGLLGFRADWFERAVLPRLKTDSMHYAAAQGDNEAIAALLEAGVDVDAVDSYGWTALHYAAFCGRTDTVSQLCAVPASLAVGDRISEHLISLISPLRNIHAKHINDEVRAVLKDETATKLPHEDWLHYYIRTGRNEQAITLIETAADVEQLIHAKQNSGENGYWQPPTRSALHAAVRYGNLDLVKYLHEEQQMDINYVGQEVSNDTPLHEAAQYEQVEVARYLLAHGAEVQSKADHGFEPLHSAVVADSIEMVELLLENGADINALTTAAKNPLHFSVQSHTANLAMVELLVARGAKIDQVDNYGKTPLDLAKQEAKVFLYDKAVEQDLAMEILIHNAVKIKRMEEVERLIAAGVDVNARDAKKHTPLQIAIRTARGEDRAGQLEMARVLLAAGADPNLASLSDMPPLMIAIVTYNKDMIELLLAHGADPLRTHSLSYGRNAIQVAEDRFANANARFVELIDIMRQVSNEQVDEP